MSKGTKLSDNVLLKDYIDENTGLVNYQKLKADNWLHDKLEEWEKADLSNFSKNEEFAFWLNAYNLFTLKGALIELEKDPNWKGNTSLFSKLKFFVLRKFVIAGEKINLRNLENKILRKRFRDPRLHFAINCASYSCPYLPGRLFRAEILDEYLDQLTSEFVNNSMNVLIDEQKKEIKLNMIFKWYEKDFGTKKDLVTFLQKYHGTTPQNMAEFSLEYFKYNWALNAKSTTELRL